MREFRGIFPAIVTPFTQSGDFDPGAMRRIVRYQLAAGVHGFYLCGGTGEGLLLTREEHRAVSETVVDEVGGKVPVISHVGAFRTDETLLRAEDARAAGVDAIAALPPAYFYKLDEKGLVGHYAKLAETAALPLLIYNIPQRTGVTMTSELYARLLEIDHIVGMKDSSGDVYALGRFAAQQPDAVLFNGEDRVLLGGLLAGACGGIGMTYNLMPRRFVKLWESVQAGNQLAAAKMQEGINECIAVIISFEGIAATKQIMAWLGHACGEPRSPIRPLDEDERSRLRKTLDAVGFFKEE